MQSSGVLITRLTIPSNTSASTENPPTPSSSKKTVRNARPRSPSTVKRTEIGEICASDVIADQIRQDRRFGRNPGIAAADAAHARPPDLPQMVGERPAVPDVAVDP